MYPQIGSYVEQIIMTNNFISNVRNLVTHVVTHDHPFILQKYSEQFILYLSQKVNIPTLNEQEHHPYDDFCPSGQKWLRRDEFQEISRKKETWNYFLVDIWNARGHHRIK